MKRIRFAVIGLGIGALHLDAIVHQKNAEIMAICDINEEILRKKTKEYEVPFSCTDYRDLVNRDDIDAVCVATPDFLHKEMVIDFLKAGKHVLCEKPLSLSSDDCKAMIDVAEAGEAKLMVGQVCRKTPAFVYAKKLVDEGVIGELFFVESEYAHDYTDIYAEGSARGIWRRDPARNGVVGGGCHAVDLLRWVAGNPEEVMAYGTHKTFADVTPYDDTHIAVMKFADNVIGKVFVSISCRRDYTMRSVFYGTNGTIIADNTSSCITVFKKDVFPGMDNHTLPITVPVDVNNHNAEGEFKEFFDIIRNDKPVKTTVYEGANTIAACLAIVEAAEKGKPIQPKYFN